MSLVLDALRRVERSTGEPGRAGEPLEAFRPVHEERYPQVWPLLLGLVVGGFLVALSGEGRRATERLDALVPPPSPASRARGGAGLPPPSFHRAESAEGGLTAPVPATRRPSVPSAPGPRRARGPVPVTSPPPPAFVLQAISERDSRLLAVINDRLVAEGDAVGSARVLRIDAESVLMGWPDGRQETVVFPPLPLPEASPSPLPR